jgi:hypothetical protein
MKPNAITVLAALLVGIGVAFGGFFVGQGFVKARLGDRSVSVKGLSERDVKADLALWPIRFVVTGNDLAAVQAKVKQDSQTVTEFLRKHGFDDESIAVESPQVTDLLAQTYRSGPVESRFIIAQLVMLRSNDVDKVAQANRDASGLVEAGIVLSSDQGPSRPSYLFTRINEQKSEMIEEATKRAREAAETFARDSGSRLGGIRRAYQGQFEILARDNAPGISESEQIAKTLRVVSTIEYRLAD